MKVTNNLHELMLKESAARTLSSGVRFPMRDLDVEFASRFGMSKHAIMSIRQNRYQPKIEDAFAFCKYFNITLEEFFNCEEED